MGLLYSKEATVTPVGSFEKNYAFNGVEDYDANHPIYYMIFQDDLQYLDVLSARYSGSSTARDRSDFLFFTLPIEKWMPLYNEDVLKHWIGWRFSVGPKKAKISMKLVKNGAICKFTELDFLISKLDEDLELDYNFLFECLIRVKAKARQEDLETLQKSLDFYLFRKTPSGSRSLMKLVGKLRNVFKFDAIEKLKHDCSLFKDLHTE